MTRLPKRGGEIAGRACGGVMQFAAHRAREVLAVTLFLVIVSILFASRLGIDADSSKMLSPELPDQRRAAALAKAFPDLKRAIVIVVRSEQSDAADLVVAKLVEALETHESVDRIYAPAVDPFLVAHGLFYRKTDVVDQAMTRLSASANLLAQLRTDQTVSGFVKALDDARALSEKAELGPDSLDRLYGEAARVISAHLADEPYSFAWSEILGDESESSVATRLITVTPRLDLTRISPAKPALEAIHQSIADLPTPYTAFVEIGVTGEPALRAEEMQSVLGTIGISLSLSLLFVAVILWIGLRSIGRAALAFGSLIVTLALTAGFVGLALDALNLISIAFVVLMVGLGIDFAIHILTHITEMRRHGTVAIEALALTGQRMGLAILLSAATTSIAFLTFGVTDFNGMAQLGLIGGVGVLIACAVSLTLLPAVVALRPSLADAPSEPLLRLPVVPGVSEASVSALIIVLAGAAAWPALSARFEADPMGLRDPESSSVKAFNLLARTPETSPYRVSVLAGNAAEAEAIADRFANQEDVGGAIWLGDLIPKEQDEKLALLDIAYPSIEIAVAGDPTDLAGSSDATGDPVDAFFDALRDQNTRETSSGAIELETALGRFLSDRDAAADTELQERLFRTFPMLIDRLAGMLEADFVEPDILPETMRERFLNENGIYRVEILPERDLRDPEALSEFAAKVRSIEPSSAGGPVQLEAAGQAIGFAMLQATLLAGLATGLLAWFATRSLTDALAILGPLVVAGVFTAAASTILGMPFNYANVIVLPLMIGIGVDSGIHIALRERRAPGAVFQTSTPSAVLFSALTTVAAFGTLALSDHRGTASMGVLLAVSVASAVICVMALTPTVIRWTRNRT